MSYAYLSSGILLCAGMPVMGRRVLPPRLSVNYERFLNKQNSTAIIPDPYVQNIGENGLEYLYGLPVIYDDSLRLEDNVIKFGTGYAQTVSGIEHSGVDWAYFELYVEKESNWLRFSKAMAFLCVIIMECWLIIAGYVAYLQGLHR